MSISWTPYIVLSALTISAISAFIWNMRRKRFVKVGNIGNLFFYPVKSLKAVEVTKGKCTKQGFEVNGISDRSFMIVDKDGVVITQIEAPNLALLTPHISGNYIIINGPDTDTLKVEIKASPSPTDKIINCIIHKDTIRGTDCGDEAALWFQSYLKKEGVRLGEFQDSSGFHVLSQASIDDLNSRLDDEKKISVYNFRPNILVTGCKPYAEDSWKFMKFNSGAELKYVILADRCLQATNDPEKGILSQKEPLVTLRKYRIPKDLSKIIGSLPCFGTHCALTSPGEITVGDEIFAVVGDIPKMK